MCFPMYQIKTEFQMAVFITKNKLLGRITKITLLEFIFSRVCIFGSFTIYSIWLSPLSGYEIDKTEVTEVRFLPTTKIVFKTF